MVKLMFIDLETGGIDPYKNGPLEIGMILETKDSIKEYQLFVKPMPEDIVSPQALKVNKLKLEDLKTFPDSRYIYRELSGIFTSYVNKYDRKDKFFFIGYNAQFDYNFMRAFFDKCGDKYFGSYVFYPPYDVMQLCLQQLLHIRHEMVDFKLTTVAPECGIPMDMESAHGALYDIQVTRDLFWKYNDRSEIFK